MFTLIFWLTGVLVGSFVLLFTVFVYEDAAKHWLLFTVFWPFGLVILAVIAVKETYLIIKKILYN